MPEADLNDIETDIPAFGNVSNIEPLLATFREKR